MSVKRLEPNDMSTPTRVTLKNVAVALTALILGSVAWRLMEGDWPNFAGLGAVGAVFSMAIAWTADEAFAAGIKEGQKSDLRGQPPAESGPPHSKNALQK
jgi:hypothetical protein